MINFEKQTWYNKNDTANADKRIPITADHLNRFEEGIDYSVDGVNKMFNYWWRKSEVVDRGLIKTGTSAQGFGFYIWDSSSQETTVYYSDSASVNIDKSTGKGYIELDNPSSLNIAYNSVETDAIKNAFKSKYFMLGVTSGQEVYYMMSSGYTQRESNTSKEHQYGVTFRDVWKYKYFLTRGNLTYVESDKVNAYPNGWSSNTEAFYEFLGTPFENSRESFSMMDGQYCGDNTESRSIKTLQKPKCVWWQPASSSQTIVTELFKLGSYTSNISLADEGFIITGNKSNTNYPGTIYSYIIFY